MNKVCVTGKIIEYIFDWNVKEIIRDKVSIEKGCKYKKFCNPKNIRCVWKLRLYFKEVQSYVSMRLFTQYPFPKNTEITYSIGIFQIDKALYPLKKGKMFGKTAILPYFIRKEDLENLKNEDNLSIRILLRETTTKSPFDVPIDRHSMPFDEANNRLCNTISAFRQTYEPDITVIVRGEKLMVHKCVLCLRSPVFMKMFEHEMREKITETIVIDNFSMQTIESLFYFMYYNRPKELYVKIACELYAAARFYQIDELSDICMEYMKSNIFHNTVCELYNNANMHKIDEIVKDCVDFMKKNWSEHTVCKVLRIALCENEEELKSLAIQYIYTQKRNFFKTGYWKKFVSEHPDYALKILQAYMEK